MVALESQSYPQLRTFIKQQNRFDTILDCTAIIDSSAKEFSLDYLFLFGSSARGTALYDSDIDLLILSRRKDHAHIACALEDRISEILSYHHPDVQITVVDTDKFANQDDDLGFFQTVAPDIKLLGRYSDGF